MFQIHGKFSQGMVVTAYIVYGGLLWKHVFMCVGGEGLHYLVNRCL